VLAAGVALSGCAPADAVEALVATVKSGAPDARVSMLLQVPDEALVLGSEFDEAPDTDYFVEQASYELPVGSLLYQDSDRFATVLMPGATSDVLIALATLDLDSGVVATVMERAVEDASRYCIYDARANDQVIIWVESEMTQGKWKVYGARFEGGVRGEPFLLDSGGAGYEAPQLCVHGPRVYWTVMPDPLGAASAEDSLLKTASFVSLAAGAGAGAGAGGVARDGQDLVRTLYVSHGRMTTCPQAADGIITIVPRVNTDAVRYQMTALHADTGQVADVALLPSGLRLSDCVHLAGAFSFCIEANYDYAGGLRYFGTYQQLQDGNVFYANKVPSSPPVSSGGCLMIKSTKNVVGFDMARRRFFILDKLDDSADYGDVLAGSGLRQRLVVYTTVTSRTSAESSVRVRVFRPA
jgi:hypothetical protein